MWPPKGYDCDEGISWFELAISFELATHVSLVKGRTCNESKITDKSRSLVCLFKSLKAVCRMAFAPLDPLTMKDGLCIHNLERIWGARVAVAKGFRMRPAIPCRRKMEDILIETYLADKKGLNIMGPAVYGHWPEPIWTWKPMKKMEEILAVKKARLPNRKRLFLVADDIGTRPGEDEVLKTLVKEVDIEREKIRLNHNRTAAEAGKHVIGPLNFNAGGKGKRKVAFAFCAACERAKCPREATAENFKIPAGILFQKCPNAVAEFDIKEDVGKLPGED